MPQLSIAITSHSLAAVSFPVIPFPNCTVSIRIIVGFLWGKCESRIPFYMQISIKWKIRKLLNVLLCYSLHPDGCCCGVWWWVVEQVPRQVAADDGYQLAGNHRHLLRLVFLDVGRRRRTDSSRRSVLRHLRLLFRPPPQVIVTPL